MSRKVLGLFRSRTRNPLILKPQSLSLSLNDAGVDALILFDLFELDVPMSMEDRIADLEPVFNTYFDD